jgi:hypothetical protein
MSQEHVEIVRRGYEHFAATGDFLAEMTIVLHSRPSSAHFVRFRQAADCGRFGPIS